MWREIITVIILIIMQGVGVIIFGSINQTNQYKHMFIVEDSSQDQYLYTNENQLYSIQVYKYNGTTWSVVDPSYWTYYPDLGLIIVRSEGL